MKIRSFPIMLAFAVVLFGAANALSQQTAGRSERVSSAAEFRSDGCTFFRDGDYRNCCVEHDRAYFAGGTMRQRHKADLALYRCVAANGGGRRKMLAGMMWIGARVGGLPLFPTPFRWGFGRRWPDFR